METLSFTYKAVFWIPGKSRNKYPGTLIYTEGKSITSEIMGEVPELKYMIYQMNTHDAYPFIHGLTSSGEKFTLINSRLSDIHKSNPGFQVASYYSKFLFLYGHFKEDSNFNFSSVLLRFQQLNQWIGHNTKKQFPDNEDHYDQEDITFTYHRPPSISFYKSPLFEINIEFGNWITANFSSFVEFNQNAYIKINFIESAKFKSAIQLIQQLKYFFSLALIENIGIEHFSFKPLNSETSVDVFQPENALFKKPSSILPSMYFKYEDIKDKTQNIFTNWFTLSDKASHSLDLFFETRVLYQSLPTKIIFLNWLQAIETIHKQILLPQEQNPFKKQPIIFQEIIDSLSFEQHKQFLLGKQGRKFSSFSLEDRLVWIFENYKDILSVYFSNTNELIKEIVSTRNHFIHDNSEKVEKMQQIIPDDILYKYNNLLRIIYQVILLKVLCFNDDFIKLGIYKYGPNHSYFNKPIDVNNIP